MMFGEFDWLKRRKESGRFCIVVSGMEICYFGVFIKLDRTEFRQSEDVGDCIHAVRCINFVGNNQIAEVFAYEII